MPNAMFSNCCYRVYFLSNSYYTKIGHFPKLQSPKSDIFSWCPFLSVEIKCMFFYITHCKVRRNTEKERETLNMNISHLNSSIRYIGRWICGEYAAVTTSPGASLEIAFQGDYCELLFDVKLNAEPFPHIYIQLDDGAKIETRIDHYIRVDGIDDGNHVLRVIFKSAVEDQQRWYEPLVGKLAFMGAEASGEGALPEDKKGIIEFIGDSITEGIWVDEYKMPYGARSNHRNMVFENDSTATYAYLTAEALGMKPWIMGYGSVGITKAGGGGVPKASEAYPYCYYQNPVTPVDAEVIVINHGANDYLVSAEEYTKGYEMFLDMVRVIHPSAIIVALSAFCGCYSAELGKMVEEYNQNRSDNIRYIDTSGWIPNVPLHPTREGHKIVAQKLVKILKEIIECK